MPMEPVWIKRMTGGGELAYLIGYEGAWARVVVFDNDDPDDEGKEMLVWRKHIGPIPPKAGSA